MSSESSDDHDDDSPLAFVLHNAVESGDETLLQSVLFGQPSMPAVDRGALSCYFVLVQSPTAAAMATHHLAWRSAWHCCQAREVAAMQLLEMLLAAGASAVDIDDVGRTPLHWAAAAGLLPAITPLTTSSDATDAKRMQSYRQDVEALQALGVEVPPPPEPLPALPLVQDHDGYTSLHLAAYFGHSPFVAKLLQPGQGWDTEALAKVRAKDGSTALHVAASRGRSRAAHALLAALPGAAAAAMLKLPNKKGLAAAELAQRAGHKALAAALRARLTNQEAAFPEDDTTAPSTLVLAPDECLLHLTAPEPMARGSSPPPPENVERLRVLTEPGSGILRCSEFSHLGWETQGLPSATMSDLLRCHDWSYVRRIANMCRGLADNFSEIGRLDPDTAISHHSYLAALKAAGAVCAGVDRVMEGQARNVFCAVRPPGHHAGPDGTVTCANDPNGSHGFCLFSNVAIGAAYAMNVYRHRGIKKVALLDFDVHHGNGTEAVVANTVPSSRKVPFSTPYSEGMQEFPTFKPWLDITDSENILFASVQGYGERSMGSGGWFYPGSGETMDTKPPAEAGTAAGMAGVAAPAAEQKVALASGLAPEDPDGVFTPSTSDRGGQACSGPRIINVGVPGPGSRRLMWRRAWRDKILPAVYNFKPDIIIVSAGFDAHKKEDINLRFVGVTEHDYEWITQQCVELANKCCGGRLVSVLEGGYNLRGGLVSAFARSVAAHVRALADGNSHTWDPKDSEMERQLEAKRKEAAAGVHVAAAAHAAASNVAAAKNLPTADAAAAQADVQRAEAPTSAPAAAPTAEAMAVDEPAKQLAALQQQQEETVQADGGSEAAGNKRRRRGGPVDYAALNAQLEAEAAAKVKAEGGN